MRTIRVAKRARSQIARRLLRIAGSLMRMSIFLYERHPNIPIIVRVTSSVVRVLERAAVVMLYGFRTDRTDGIGKTEL